MTIQNPHDRFFRQSFQSEELARSYLQTYLPPDLLRILNLETLHLQDGSFIDEEMQSHQTDILYQTQLQSGEPVTIYFLFEHKSYADGRVALQLLRYMVRVWERQEKEGTRLLTPIIPLVLYHGARRWSVSHDFASLVAGGGLAELRPYLPDFRYQLNDFSHLSDEAIGGSLRLQVSLEVLRAVFNPRLREDLGRLVGLLMRLLEQRTGLEYLHTVLYYLSTTVEGISRAELERELVAHGEQGEELMATIAQELRQEGIQQGVRGALAGLRQD
jgi:predicted transposase/invertase (TIGR01784 family)